MPEKRLPAIGFVSCKIVRSCKPCIVLRADPANPKNELRESPTMTLSSLHAQTIRWFQNYYICNSTRSGRNRSKHSALAETMPVVAIVQPCTKNKKVR